MGRIDYQKIYATNQDEWKALTREPQKYEALLAGHYSDSNHFVYELLQNAEDEKATRVVIEFYKDQLVFYHNGDPFDEEDVRGVASMLMGTKDRNDAQTIGRFGMGFKSVFKYTYQPEIYSDDEAFLIKNYLLPVENNSNWDYQAVKSTLAYPDGNMTQYLPYVNSRHLTKIVIPFKKRNEKGELTAVSGRDVLDKLNSLSGEILLFLTYIRNLYWINKENGKYVHITLNYAGEDNQLLTCRMSGSESGGKEEISRYLRYKKVFDHPDMKSAEVAVAYRLNVLGRNINETEHTPVWVYFPTRDMTDLPFLIHGSFETAVSREKLMTPSAFNDSLFDKLGDLIAESMMDLAKRNLITQMFLRRVVLAAFQDEMKNGTIKGLKDKVTRVFSEKSILPDRLGECRNKTELAIPVPFQMADLKDSVLWKEAFYAVDHFVAFNNERERNFNEYFTWLRDDLSIQTFDLSRWAIELCKLPVQSISVSEIYLGSLKALYDLLSDYRESLYRTNLSYTRGGAYELAIRACLPKAWPNLRKAPVILNAENDLVPAYEDNSLAVYLNASSRYRTLRPSSIVSTRVAKEYESLFKDGFQIAEFDNYQFVKEKIIKKYIRGNGAKIGFEDETHFEREYIEDINQLLGLIEESGNTADVMALLRNAYIIKIKTEDGSNTFAFPHTVYVDTSDEGIDLLTYYAPVTMSYEVDYDEENDRPIMEEGDPYNFNHEQIDREFYEDHGVSLSKMKKLGLITTPVIEGERADYSGTGDGYWRALGEFCPNIEIDGLEDNIEYIEGNPQSDLAKKKSAELMKLLLSISGKLSGVVRKRKNNPYDSHEKAAFLWSLDYNDWLFDKNGELHHPSQMSRYDLDEEIYSELPNKKEAYAVLGFVEKEADAKADTFEMVGALDRRDKTIMFRQLAKELGYDISDISRIQPTEEEDEGGTFDPNAWQSEEFPQRRVRNMDSLIEHVRQEFFCADPVRYQKVLRQIRTSKSPKTIRAYTLGMYVNESDTQICQMCKKATPYVDVTEIVNYGIEMPQLNLCLCRNCSSRYKQFRDGNKEKFKEEMTRALRNIDIGIPAEDYEIELSSDTSIHFTQTHLAEVKEILSLLEQYGIPGQEEPEKPEKQVTRNNMSSSPVNPQREKKPVYMVDHRREDQRRDRTVERPMPDRKPSMAQTPRQEEKRNLNSQKPASQTAPKVGAHVRHKAFGDGVITYIDGPYIGVSFQKVGKKKFPVPDAFIKGFLMLL